MKTMNKRHATTSRLTRLAACFWREDAGVGTAFYALGMMGLLVAGAFIVDTLTATGDAAQIKRATDAAALAVGRQALIKNSGGSEDALRQQLAYDYVRANLGLNSTLANALTSGDVSVSEGQTRQERKTYTVEVTFTTAPSLLQLSDRQQEIHSTVEVIYRPAEVALTLPNTLSEGASELGSLRRLANHFADALLSDAPDRRLALVPYSQTVNVYDADNWSSRIRSWPSSAALKPVELTSLFNNNDYGIANLASRMMPDLQDQRMCLHRGLYRGENYFWDRAPAGTFSVHYRADLPENAPGMPWIQWTGPNPTFGQATGTNDTRYIVADKGCPTAALLPLTDDLPAIAARLDQMESQFNVNYALAMGWAAMSLAPAFRGEGGWGDTEYPLDFDDNGSGNIKAIVMLANTTGDWFDTDAYSYYVGQTIDEASGSSEQYQVVTARFQSLCASFRERNLLFYFIGVRPGDPEDFGRTLFDTVARPGLLTCTNNNGGSMTFADSATFAGAEDDIADKLDAILADIETRSSYVRLIE